jgi:hypothetical protein
MKKKVWTAAGLGLLAALLVAGAAWAMSSDNFRLEWNVSDSSAGGGPAGSTNYAVNYTIGQNAAGGAGNFSASTNYSAGLGYWARFPFEFSVLLPAALDNS